jgi:hypothetical protein
VREKASKYIRELLKDYPRPVQVVLIAELKRQTDAEARRRIENILSVFERLGIIPPESQAPTGQ